MGDNRYLVGGGTDDQPAARWIAAGQAGKTYYILEQQAEATEQVGIDDRLKPADLKLYKETIYPLYKRVKQEIHATAD
jgi:hypothetical protein